MKLTDILKAIGVIAQVLPALIAMIREVEGQAAGAVKKDAILAFLDTLLKGLGSFVSELSEPIQAAIRAVAGPVIDAVVAAFNLVGIFKKPGA